MIDTLLRTNKLDFVRSQLSQYGGLKKEAGNRMMILCPYHSERTPSGSINIGQGFSPGFFRCFACSAKAPWDEVALKLGLQPFKAGPPKDEHTRDMFMHRAMERLAQDEGYRKDKFKFWELPRHKVWRTIPTELLRELGGRMCYKWSPQYERWGTTKFIHLPVNINGETMGFFLARLKKDTSDKKLPSYLLAAAVNPNKGWSRSHGLWPFDYAIEMMVSLKSRTMVIVEGQRDALRLLTLGVPAMYIFGTQSWSDNKAKLLEIAGVDQVITLMDGDCAGKHATEKISPQLRTFFTVRKIKLWAIKGSPYIRFKDEVDPTKAAKAAGVELWDPGNMPQRIIEKLKRKYF